MSLCGNFGLVSRRLLTLPRGLVRLSVGRALRGVADQALLTAVENSHNLADNDRRWCLHVEVARDLHDVVHLGRD